MAIITLPREFFVKEREQAYSDWKDAFWRELFTNAADAGASRVDIEVKAAADDVFVSFADNGCGMTEEVLRDVYFSLGKSTKDSGGSVGGFGRARVLTCFSMNWYKIWTGNVLASGSCAEYEIEQSEVYNHGCRVSVGVPDTNANEMEEKLRNYLAKCADAGIDVKINGESFSHWNVAGDVKRKLHYREAEWAKVHHVEPGSFPNTLIVRVNGVAMYENWVQCDGQVVVEIDPAISRNVLTANRDGMHYYYQESLNSFVRELGQRGARALKDKPPARITNFPGTGNLTTRNPKFNGEVVKRDTVFDKECELKVCMIMRAPPSQHRSILAETREAVLRTEVDTPTRHRVSDFLPNIQLHIDHHSPYVWEKAQEWDPSFWEFEIHGDRAIWLGNAYKKASLLFMWKRACELAIQTLIARKDISSIQWTVGFCFEEDVLAKHVNVGGVHILMIKPLDDAGDWIYRGRDSRRELLACALHEVCHIIHPYHNEDFAALLTAMFAWCEQACWLKEIGEAFR